MNQLCTDIGYLSLIKHGEQLCGDHVDTVVNPDGTVIAVLADGLGSGVKACILSTLTSKIISTMLASSMSIFDCVQTVVSTLPVCSVRGVAYSAFSIICIYPNSEAEIISYDIPKVIFLRGGKNVDLPESVTEISGKSIYSSKVTIKEGDVFLALSDGCIHAGMGISLNFGWERKEIIEFLEMMYSAGDGSFTAKTLSTMVTDECNRLYGYKPGDDTTACCIKIRRREPMNLIIGPPANPDDVTRMLSLFFAKQGKHIVCGGTTSSLVAEFLGEEVEMSLDYFDDEIPPTASIKGVDLVTEGIVTINRVLTYANSYLSDNECYKDWGYKKDGASCISRLLFEEATDINFFVGRAVNPAHQNPSLPINFSIKMQLIKDLAECLRQMGKRVKVSHF